MANVLWGYNISTRTARCVRGVAATNHGGLLLPINNHIPEGFLFDLLILINRRFFPCSRENLYPPRGEYRIPSQYQTGEMFYLVRWKTCPRESILRGVRGFARLGSKVFQI